MNLKALLESSHYAYLRARTIRGLVWSEQFSKVVQYADDAVADMIRENDSEALLDWMSAMKDLEDLTIRELRELSSAYRIAYYAELSKQELIGAISNARKTTRNGVDNGGSRV